ncbi:MAG TPA: hypothetical protein VNL74_01650 [Methylococcus sp.]|nr:hypothetical protein [Methylococcus sp.]
MATWDEIKQDIENNGNVLTINMEVLRDAIGAGKLGVNVRNDISRALAGMGLGHIPQVLPTYQHEQVRLYKRGTAVGELIDTVLTPGQQNDQKLVERLGEEQPDFAAIVQQIRELVAE